MDDTKKARGLSFLILIVTAAVLGSQAAAGAELEYISPEMRDNLAKQFAAAQIKTADSEKLLSSNQANAKHWVCDMYGMRTGLQIKRGLKLYEFKKTAGSITNSGSHPINVYRATESEWIGTSEKVEDHIRLNSDGQLIAELRTPSPNGHVIAYSICRR